MVADAPGRLTVAPPLAFACRCRCRSGRSRWRRPRRRCSSRASSSSSRSTATAATPRSATCPRVYLHRGMGPGVVPVRRPGARVPGRRGPAHVPRGAGRAVAARRVRGDRASVPRSCASPSRVVLERHDGARAWRWAVGVPVMLYAFQNWDVYAVALLLAGIFLFERRRDTLAGVALGLGAAVKLFPAVAVPPLAALRWQQGDRRGALRLVGAAGAVLLLVQPAVRRGEPRRAGAGPSRSRARARRRGGAPSSTCCASSVRRCTARRARRSPTRCRSWRSALGLGGLTLLALRRPMTAAGRGRRRGRDLPARQQGVLAHVRPVVARVLRAAAAVAPPLGHVLRGRRRGVRDRVRPLPLGREQPRRCTSRCPCWSRCARSCS